MSLSSPSTRLDRSQRSQIEVETGSAAITPCESERLLVSWRSVPVPRRSSHPWLEAGGFVAPVEVTTFWPPRHCAFLSEMSNYIGNKFGQQDVDKLVRHCWSTCRSLFNWSVTTTMSSTSRAFPHPRGKPCGGDTSALHAQSDAMVDVLLSLAHAAAWLPRSATSRRRPTPTTSSRRLYLRRCAATSRRHVHSQRHGHHCRDRHAS